MTVDGLFCNGHYRVVTTSFEMRMSHWIDAPLVKRVEDGTTVLDLSSDIWDLQDVREEGDVLVLVMRKYSGLTNGVEVKILPERGRFEVDGRTLALWQLKWKLKSYK